MLQLHTVMCKIDSVGEKAEGHGHGHVCLDLVGIGHIGIGIYRYRLLILIVGVAGCGLILMFPPYLSVFLGRRGKIYEGNAHSPLNSYHFPITKPKLRIPTLTCTIPSYPATSCHRHHIVGHRQSVKRYTPHASC